MSTHRPTAASQPADAPLEYTPRQIRTILIGLLLGMFLGALDQTIVSTSIRTISDDLHGLSAQAWATTAYLVTSTISTPIYGKLGDLWGRKRLFGFAITVFIIGSALCSFAGSMTQLAVFRAIQGLGAGGLFTLVLAIIGDIVPPRTRAKYTGYFMAMFGSASVLGPVIGGFLAGADSIAGVTGWRWVFLVNVPVGLLALVVIGRTLHLTHVRRQARVDWPGALALALCLVPLLTVAEQGRIWGWTSGRSVLCFVVGLIGLILFVTIEGRMREDALIPFSLFRIRAARVTLVASVMIGMCFFGALMLLPLYMQIVHGASPTRSGFLMVPMVFGLMTAAAIGGQVISRTGRPRIFPIYGALLIAAGMAGLTQIGADTALWKVMLLMFVTGHGLGCTMQPLVLTVQSAVPPSAIGVATAGSTFFRQIGGTIGVAVLLSIVFGSVQQQISTAFADEAKTARFQTAVAVARQEPPTSLNHRIATGDQTLLAGLSEDSSVIARIDPVLAHPIKVGFSNAITSVFWITSGLGLLAFLVLLGMPDMELRRESAAVAAAAEAPEPTRAADR
jgi:EmrB/QacA subfamily drug resistance transporter